MNWGQWIDRNLPALKAGKKLGAPEWLGPPADAGFRRVTSAAYEGQVADWALPQCDGSRIHVHEYANATRIVHRDQYDPDRNLANTLRHLVFDTPLGVAALAAGAVWVLSQEG